MGTDREHRTNSAGRPRSQQTHDAILSATLALLGEEGWEGLTIEGIARRARVGKAAIYRRWDGLDAVLTAAVDRIVSEIGIPDRGSIREDLLVLMRQAVTVWSGPSGRMMPGLVAAMAHHPRVARAVREGFLATRRHALAEVVERAVSRGELRPDFDRELTLDFLAGPLFYRLLVTGAPVDERLAHGTVDILLRGLATASRD